MITFAVILTVCCTLCNFIGFYFGKKGERQSWLHRAEGKDREFQSAHHCNGKFYYIIEERWFTKNYKLVVKETEHGSD